MAVCNFDMQFTFACAGWEGTAHDTRIFLSSIRNDALKFPKPPNGKYYLVDAGYPQMKGYLGPYRGGVRYHLPQFRYGGEPTGSKEVFNHMHSSLRSVIERTFGAWKKKFKILKDMPSYPFITQVKIIIATMTLHNYVRKHSRHDIHFNNRNNVQNEMDMGGNAQEEHGINYNLGAQEMDIVRNDIAASLMSARSP
ncbi:uncharacterized protein LOC121051661 [Rosa chinensis]|uniref:uncharacterized protein LOC121051661 n=1 Tax=Rosa chinensis TaxID=74649 RepID=UPI001AD8CEDC|nr:uncharacterized protein LOC121051661 [Rosa chinensis]